MSSSTDATLLLTQALIRRPSVSPEDQGCLQIIAERLQVLGVSVERMPFGPVENIWARHGKTSPVLCFAGHTDVVPTGPRDEWQTDPFEPVVKGDTLYGRGAADMKSGLAAMVTATERFLSRHPDHSGSLALLLTSDEEGPSVDGTRRVMEVLEARSEKIDWCVVGEPSSSEVLGDIIKIGRRGSLSGKLTVHGIQGETTDAAVVGPDVDAAGLYVGLTRGRHQNIAIAVARTDEEVIAQVGATMMRGTTELTIQDAMRAADAELRRVARERELQASAPGTTPGSSPSRGGLSL